MIRFKGTKTEILNQWTKDYQEFRKDGGLQNPWEDFSVLFDLIQSNIGEEELFTITNREEWLKNQLLTAEAEYYISIKKGTLMLCCLIMQMMSDSPLESIASFLGEKYLEGKINGPLWKKLSSALGESCIMLEAIRNKKEGISKNYFKKFHGECVNNHLKCNYRQDGRCKCTVQEMEEICEDLKEQGLLVKKRNKYFYYS